MEDKLENLQYLSVHYKKQSNEQVSSELSKINTTISTYNETTNCSKLFNCVLTNFLISKSIALYNGEMPDEMEDCVIDTGRNSEESKLIYIPNSPIIKPKLKETELSDFQLSQIK
jgi:hypothetical protein